MHRQLLFFTTALFFLMASCSEDAGIVAGLEGEFEFDTAEDGSFLKQGDSIPIVLKEIGNQSSSVDIFLKSPDGKILASAQMESELLKGMGMPLEIPGSITDGLYYLDLSVTDGDSLLFKESRHYYIVGGKYHVRELESYPSKIKPKDQIQAKTVLSIPQDSNPWLKWFLDDTILDEGYVSDLGYGCKFTAPDADGVYSLKLELFPVKPEDGHKYSSFRQADLFVNSRWNDMLSWLRAENMHYLYYIDFSGGPENVMESGDPPKIQGKPVVRSLGNDTGMAFGENDGIGFASFALPLDPDRRVGNFTLSLSFSFDELPESGNFNILRTGQPDAGFSLYYTANKEEQLFVCELLSGDDAFRSTLPPSSFEALKKVSLVLGYDDSEDLACIDWIKEGKLLHKDTGNPGLALMEGETVLGGYGEKPGLPVVWYSVEIFTKKKVPEVLPRDSGIKDNKKEGKPVAEPELPRQALLFERTQKTVSPVVINHIAFREGLSSTVFKTDRQSLKKWTVVFSDAHGNEFYQLSPGDFDGGSQEGDDFVVSLANDSRGLFFGTNLDTGISGPFECRDLLNMRIISNTEAPASLKDIQSVILYRE